MDELRTEGHFLLLGDRRIAKVAWVDGTAIHEIASKLRIAEKMISAAIESHERTHRSRSTINEKTWWREGGL